MPNCSPGKWHSDCVIVNSSLPRPSFLAAWLPSSVHSFSLHFLNQSFSLIFAATIHGWPSHFFLCWTFPLSSHLVSQYQLLPAVIHLTHASQLSLPDTRLSVHSWWCFITYCPQSKHGDSALLTNQNPTDKGTVLFTKRKLSRDSHVTLWIKDWDPGSCSSLSSPSTSGKLHLSYFSGFLSCTFTLSQSESPFLCLSWTYPSSSWILLTFTLLHLLKWVPLSEMRWAQ